MSEYEQAVFISYAWGEETHEREAIVNQLDQSLQKRGLKIIRDKRDLGYKGMIRQFMERIGEGDCVIVVISDKYLRSKNCMYELVEIAENKDFAQRIFPIVLSDAKIYDGVDRITYLKHWEQKRADLNKQMLSLSDLSQTSGISEELNDYNRFRNEIDGLTNLLKNMNTLSPDILRNSDFQQLYDAIIERTSSTWMKSKDGNTQPTAKKERKIMDPITLAAAATALLSPFIKKAGESAAEKLGEKLPEALGKIWNAIANKPSITEAAGDLAKNPDDADNEVVLKKQLQKALEKDQDFARLLTDLIEDAKKDSAINIGGDGVVANNNSTAVGSVNIGGNVSGGFSIGNNNQSKS